MRAITIRAPWAWAVANGAKPVENRARDCTHRGAVTVHCARRLDTAGLSDPRIQRLFFGPGHDPQVPVPEDFFFGMLGKAVALADLVDCHEAWTSSNPDLVAEGATCCSPWGSMTYKGRPAWHLELQRSLRLPQPVRVRGQLTVPWTLPPEVAEQVAQQAQAGGWL